MVKSNELPHSSFCNHQVPLKERDFSQFVLENGTKLEIQNEKFVVLVLDSLSSANSVQITLKTLSNMVKFLAKITSINPEIQSSRYHQTKGRQNIDGVDSKLLSILRTPSNFFEVIYCILKKFYLPYTLPLK